MRMTVYALPAATPVQVAFAYQKRGYLDIQNIGATNPATIGFTSAITAGQGMLLLQNGGSYDWGPDTAMCPVGEVWAVSAAGTTIAVMEG
jgi:hypothetical protein